ncbi:hypothetical protein AMAG_19001 [Allomyces macrogynus ATCC 38327]|uniref:Uncharacterized protein n=1 Tax=Allomyces macrogynus (strain ATCC 38327) TaxID=578462 RepID=A0A0L0SM03_ALLM3|nr:hypothetical protein AMAG_19001 [Allomyces macrogynus ATCC 38327]|eukprot:KNE63415.1 hypothetical protein AMAG_19001 [Allomyces macrogynus ATCC 38327]
MIGRVFPGEIEAEILKVGGVLDAVAVPIWRAGNAVVEDQLLCAAVGPRSKAVLTDPAAQQALIKSIVDSVAQAMEPRNHLTGGVVLVDAVPRKKWYVMVLQRFVVLFLAPPSNLTL